MKGRYCWSARIQGTVTVPFIKAFGQVYHRGTKWIHLSSITPATPLSPAAVVSGDCAFSPWIYCQQLGSLLWNPLVKVSFPEILQAASRNRPWCAGGCTCPFGDDSRSLYGGSRIGLFTNIVRRLWNQGLVCQGRAIITIDVLSCRTFIRHLGIMQREETDKARCWKAFSAWAYGSGYQLTLCSSCVLRRLANRSSLNDPIDCSAVEIHTSSIVIRCCPGNFQSVSVFSDPGRYSAERTIPLSRANFHIFCITGSMGAERVPPIFWI